MVAVHWMDGACPRSIVVWQIVLTFRSSSSLFCRHVFPQLTCAAVPLLPIHVLLLIITAHAQMSCCLIINCLYAPVSGYLMMVSQLISLYQTFSLSRGCFSVKYIAMRQS
jgi:hypothetical protein